MHEDELAGGPRQELNMSYPIDPANITQESMPQTVKSNLTISFQETGNHKFLKSTARNTRSKAT